MPLSPPIACYIMPLYAASCGIRFINSIQTFVMKRILLLGFKLKLQRGRVALEKLFGTKHKFETPYEFFW